MRPRVAVATSGGLDSTVLLHCTALRARPLGVDVVALHVHHGLMPQADSWLDKVRRQAKRWQVAFDARRLSGQPPPGASVEAWARVGRYAALAEMAKAHDCGLVLLAHHRRDQAETWLLQALRGAGDAGLSAMPVLAQRQGLAWARPWLNTPRAAIESYARRHRLSWVEDPSNADARFARSRLRAAVWPALEQAFPEAESALGLAARQAQSAAELAREVAAQDLAGLSGLSGPQGLDLLGWLALSPARRRNALRAWLTQQLHSSPPGTLVDRLMDELPGSRSGSWPALGGVLRAYRGRLELQPAPGAAVQALPPLFLRLDRPGAYAVAAWGGTLVVSPCREHGVPATLLRNAVLQSRRGGEQFQRIPGASARSLKKQFQALDVPAWAREGPLVTTVAGDLLYVPRLGMNARYWAAAGEPQVRLHWSAELAEPAGQKR